MPFRDTTPRASSNTVFYSASAANWRRPVPVKVGWSRDGWPGFGSLNLLSPSRRRAARASDPHRLASLPRQSPWFLPRPVRVASLRGRALSQSRCFWESRPRQIPTPTGSLLVRISENPKFRFPNSSYYVSCSTPGRGPVVLTRSVLHRSHKARAARGSAIARSTRRVITSP